MNIIKKNKYSEVPVHGIRILTSFLYLEVMYALFILDASLCVYVGILCVCVCVCVCVCMHTFMCTYMRTYLSSVSPTANNQMPHCGAWNEGEAFVEQWP